MAVQYFSVFAHEPGAQASSVFIATVLGVVTGQFVLIPAAVYIASRAERIERARFLKLLGLQWLESLPPHRTQALTSTSTSKVRASNVAHGALCTYWIDHRAVQNA